MAEGSDAVARARRGGKNYNSNSIIENILNLNRGGNKDYYKGYRLM